MKEGLTKGLNTVTQGWLEFEVSAQTSGVAVAKVAFKHVTNNLT